jgi:hypothetical protein
MVLRLTHERRFAATASGEVGERPTNCFDIDHLSRLKGTFSGATNIKWLTVSHFVKAPGILISTYTDVLNVFTTRRILY